MLISKPNVRFVLAAGTRDFKRLRVALVSAALGILAIALLTLAMRAADARRVVVAEAEAEADHLVVSLEQHAAQTFYAINSVLRLAAVEFAARRQRGAAIAEMDETLKQLSVEVRMVRSMQIVDADGVIVADSRPASAPPFDPRDREYFLAQRDGSAPDFFLGEPVRTRPSGEWRLVASRRLEDAQGKFLGIAIAALEPEVIGRFYAEQSVNDAFRITLYRDDGKILARHPFDDRSIGETPAHFRKLDRLRDQTGRVTLEMHSGEKRIAYRWIGGLPLVIAVSYDTDDVLAPWRHSLKATAWWATGAGLSMLVVLSLMLALLDQRERAARALAASEARLIDVVESASDWVWEQDADLRFTFVSAHTLSRLGVDTSALIGKRRDEVGLDIDPESWRAHKADLDARRPFRDFRVRRRLPDGRIAHSSLSGKPLFDAAGKFLGYRGTGRDVTAIATAEERAQAVAAELKQSRDLLRAVLNNVPARIHLKDRDLRYVMVNDDQLRIWGVRLDDVIGRRFEELAIPAVTPAEKAARAGEMGAKDRVILETGKTETFYQNLYSSQSRSRRAYQASKIPLLGADGQINGILTVAVDVTDLKQAEQQAKTALAELQKKRDLLQAVLDNVPARVSLKDRDRRYVLVNKFGLDSWGVTAAQALGRRREEFRSPLEEKEQDRVTAMVAAHDEEILKTGEPQLFYEDTWPGPDGEQTYHLVSKVPLRDGDGPVESVLTVSMDVTAMKRAETRAEAAAAELKKNRDLLQAVLDTVPASINVKDAERRYIMTNKAHLDDYRLTLDAVLGKRLEEIAVPTITPEEMPGFAANVARHDKVLLEGGDAELFFEEAFTNPEGKRVYWLTSKIPLRGADGKPHAILTASIDITARKEAELKLVEVNQRMADYAETSSDWFWETDTEHRYSYFSEGLKRVVGTDPARLIGHSRIKLAADRGDEPEKWQAHKADLDARRPFRGLIYSVKVDGQTRHIATSGKPVFGADERFMGYRGTGRDVTAEIQLKRALVEAKEEAEVASRAKSEFLANMSHELRTPLNAVIGFSDMLTTRMAGPLTPKQGEYLRDIGWSGRHLLDIINDVLDLSKIEAGRVELREELADLGGLIDDCTRLVRERANNARVELIERIDRSIALRVDVLAMKKILTNLLSNAVKFTLEGGCVTIEGGLNQAGECVLGVIDTGIGMSPEELVKALEPFGQVDSALTRRNQGTGLGLPLASSLAERLGGKLLIDSEPGKGTAVRVYLPAHRVLHSAA